jgi:hypothetical protein
MMVFLPFSIGKSRGCRCRVEGQDQQVSWNQLNVWIMGNHQQMGSATHNRSGHSLYTRTLTIISIPHARHIRQARLLRLSQHIGIYWWNFPDSVKGKTNDRIHVWPAQVIALCRRVKNRTKTITKYFMLLTNPSRSDWASDAWNNPTNIQHIHSQIYSKLKYILKKKPDMRPKWGQCSQHWFQSCPHIYQLVHFTRYRLLYYLRILYHFDQFDMSRITGPSVVLKISLCHRSQKPVSNRSNMWQCQNARNQLKNRLFYRIYHLFHTFWLSWPLAAPDWVKTPQKLPIWALLSVEILALSQSPAICVEVLNWSNTSQSQGCVELNEMVQYILEEFRATEVMCHDKRHQVAEI